MRFGVSTHLFHEQRLDRAHLDAIAARGFDDVELFATASHFDYHDAAAIDSLAGWLRGAGLALASVHAPITRHFGAGDAWQPDFSTASGDRAVREAAVREALAALEIAKTIPYRVLVLHPGSPDGRTAPDDNQRAAIVRSVEEIAAAAAPLGVTVALEVIPNRIAGPAALARLLDQDVDARNVGICLDLGHAHLQGDAADAVETVAEHLVTTHVHDNHGRTDEHLVPGRGTIDWPSVLMSLQKVGYDGTYLLELAGAGSPTAILEEARRARERFERVMADA